jgi:hypothetical protein
VLIENFKGLRSKVLIASKVNASRLEKEHPPFVVIGDVGLVRRDVLKRCKVVVPLEDLFEFSLNDRKVVLQLLSQRKKVGIKVFLIPQQTVLMEGLFKKPLNPQRTDLQFHQFGTCLSARISGDCFFFPVRA